MSISNNDFYKHLLDNLYDGVYFVDNFRRITYWNKGAERITGYLDEQVRGRNCSDNLLMHINESGENLCSTACPLSMTIADGESREMCVYVHHREGHRVPVLVRAAPIYSEDGRIVGAVEIFSDNSALISALSRVDELHSIATRDSLTQIPNRFSTEEHLKVKYQEMIQNGASWGLLFVDIDRFKAINDTYGHDTGDIVLKMVAGTLEKNIRQGDFVGRWGGEEFLVVLNQVDRVRLLRVAEKLRALVAGSFCQINGYPSIGVTISIGATLAHPGSSLDEIIKRADGLLYKSKAAGRNITSMDT